MPGAALTGLICGGSAMTGIFSSDIAEVGCVVGVSGDAAEATAGFGTSAPVGAMPLGLVFSSAAYVTFGSSCWAMAVVWCGACDCVAGAAREYQYHPVYLIVV